ncbi:MAG TPA: nuclear transport factor 2 family protein [Chthonomonadaceae bacterium]|nr:nuclear transport factor 2 family protein [Chthonomonadaceae bacterium]
MRRMLYVTLAVIMLGSYSLSRPGYAQDPAKDNLRNEATAFLSKFMDAANRADTKTMINMFSAKPEVSLIADGYIYQGRDAIQSHTERLFGQRDRYMVQLETMSIANVNGLVLATGPYTARLRYGNHEIAFQGAVTFLMEKEGRRHWKITHLHRSTAVVQAQRY